MFNVIAGTVIGCSHFFLKVVRLFAKCFMYCAMLCLSVSFCTVTADYGKGCWADVVTSVVGWLGDEWILSSRLIQEGITLALIPCFFGPAGLLTIHQDINRKNYTLHPRAHRRRGNTKRGGTKCKAVDD